MRFKLIYLASLLMRIACRVFYVFKIKSNRIVLSSYKGVHYNCNPRCIAEALCDDKRRDYEIIYALRQPEKYQDTVKDGIHIVKYRSLAHFYYLMTAKVIIVNVGGIAALMPYRKQQKLINTWHGGGVGKATGLASGAAKDTGKRIYEISGKNIDVFLSSSALFTATQGPSHCIPSDRFVNVGMPRNDIFFKDIEERNSICDKVRLTLGIGKDMGIALYAPTYRYGSKKTIAEYGFEQIDVKKLLVALHTRFKKEFILLFRAHTNMQPDIADECWMNVSDYNDMQELLCASDVLITDYSSSVWDFALQYKPGFIFAPDFDRFTKEQSFFKELSFKDWPYRITKGNEELSECIINYNENDNTRRINNYYKLTDSYERGTATAWVLDYIYAQTKSCRTHR